MVAVSPPTSNPTGRRGPSDEPARSERRRADQLRGRDIVADHHPALEALRHNDPSELQTLADADGLRAYGAADWGGMAVNVNHFPPGFDLTAVLEQVPGAACPVPH